MTRLVRPGIYEDLLTAAFEAGIDARSAEGWRVGVRPADATIRPAFLARHVYALVRRALRVLDETMDWMAECMYRSHGAFRAIPSPGDGEGQEPGRSAREQ